MEVRSGMQDGGTSGTDRQGGQPVLERDGQRSDDQRLTALWNLALSRVETAFLRPQSVLRSSS